VSDRKYENTRCQEKFDVEKEDIEYVGEYAELARQILF
jgi:hypothetical protein